MASFMGAGQSPYPKPVGLPPMLSTSPVEKPSDVP